MYTSVSRSIRAGIVAIGLSASGAHALADQPSRPSSEPKMTVRFGDLKTSTPAGIRSLYARIRYAALTVCSGPGDFYVSEHWARQDCYRATVDHTVSRLNLPALTALHAERAQQGPVAPPRQARNQ